MKSVFSSDCIRESCLVASVCMVKTGSVSEISFCSECNREICLVAFYMYGKKQEVSVKSILAVNVSIKSCLVAFICMVKTESVSEISFSSECIHERCLVAFICMEKAGSRSDAAGTIGNERQRKEKMQVIRKKCPGLKVVVAVNYKPL